MARTSQIKQEYIASLGKYVHTPHIMRAYFDPTKEKSLRTFCHSVCRIALDWEGNSYYGLPCETIITKEKWNILIIHFILNEENKDTPPFQEGKKLSILFDIIEEEWGNFLKNPNFPDSIQQIGTIDPVIGQNYYSLSFRKDSKKALISQAIGYENKTKK